MKRYELKEEIPSDIAQNLIEFPDLIRKLLFYRGIKDKESAERFLNPDFERDLHDPFLLPNMDKAVERILSAILENHKITIYSDYDADGIPAAVAFNDFLNKIGFNNFDVYIPHRNKEGFGLNKKAIDEIFSRGTNLIITIDCGTADVEEVNYARSLGMDVIITDHHESHDNLPDAIIVNHKLKESVYPERILCGAGVVFKLIQAIILKSDFNLPKGFEKWFLDMIGIATMADMVPLVGENRALAYYGLFVLKKTPRAGLQQLFKKTGLKQNDISSIDIGFTIAPRINAASRMGEPEIAFKMLSSKNELEAGVLVNHLHEINNVRKGHVASIVKSIYQKYEDEENIKKVNVVVCGNVNWQPSLLGLAASNIADKYKKPVFLWGRGDGVELKGSCRSSSGVSTLDLMNHVSDVMHAFGGHKEAGGFVIKNDYVDFLEEKLCSAYDNFSDTKQPDVVFIDSEITFKEIDKKLFKEIQKLGPFGVGNEEPVFLIRNTLIKEIQFFGKNKEHIKLICNNSNKNLEAISFFADTNSFSESLDINKNVSLIVKLEENQWGRRDLRLRIIDATL